MKELKLETRVEVYAVGELDNIYRQLYEAAFEASKKAPKALDFSTAEVFFRTSADAFSFHCRSIPAL